MFVFLALLVLKGNLSLLEICVFLPVGLSSSCLCSPCVKGHLSLVCVPGENANGLKGKLQTKSGAILISYQHTHTHTVDVFHFRQDDRCALLGCSFGVTLNRFMCRLSS